MSLSSEIRAELVRQGSDIESLARSVGVSRQTLSKKLNSHVEFTYGEVQRISQSLGLSLVELVRRAEEAASARGHNNPLDGKDVA